jgi:hypothetical protein
MLTTLLGTPGDDVFSAGPGWAKLNGVEYQANEVTFDGLGGYDTASLYDSPGDDLFIARPGEAELGGIKVINCEVIHGYSRGGNDTARLYDSPGDDTLVTKSWAKLFGDGFFLRAKGFEKVEAFASDGMDIASLNDSAGNDVVDMQPGDVTLFGEGSKRAVAFDYVHAYGRYGGNDVAYLTGDRATVRDTYARMFGDGFVNRAKLFEEVIVTERVNALVVGETITLTGTQTLRRPIEIGSGTTLTGGTLTRPDRVQKDLVNMALEGVTRLFVTDTIGYQVGDELGLFAYGATAEWVVVANLGSDWIEIENPLAGSFNPVDGAAVVNYFPLIRATGTNITIEGITLDGNHDLTTRQWQIVGGGLIHMEASHSVIRDVVVMDSFSAGIVLRGGHHNLLDGNVVMRSRGHGIFLDQEISTTVRFCTSSYSGYQVGKVLGDGILVNGGAHHLIENNDTNYNARYGLHPAGGLTQGGLWQNNIANHNGSNGFHFCWNNYNIVVSGNTLNFNKSGVGGLGLGGEWGDRFNLITNNTMFGNRRYGIETNGGGDNYISYNDLRGNGLGGILLVGTHIVNRNLE